MYPLKVSRDLEIMDVETRPPLPPPVEEVEELVEEDVDDLFSIFDEAGCGELDRRVRKPALRLHALRQCVKSAEQALSCHLLTRNRLCNPCGARCTGVWGDAAEAGSPN